MNESAPLPVPVIEPVRKPASWLLRLNAALLARTVAAWSVTLLLFFPLGWLILTAFKTELQAISVPPLFFFTPTLENFAEVQLRSDYLLYAKNSIITSVVSTLLGLAIAGPAAYSMT